jgi:hypothetical protein
MALTEIIMRAVARSKLVHKGRGRGENAENAAKALSLATDFARADIGYAR